MEGAPPDANEIDLFMHFLGASRDGLVARRVDLDTISSSVKCSQYGICSQATFKNARTMFYLFSGGAGSCFRAGLKKPLAGAKISREGCPSPDLTSLLVCGGVFNVLLKDLYN
jgi:hypothetical protein